MIRLIASDLDGTLLEPGERLPEGTFELIDALFDAGVRFAASSGRQLGNLRRLFAPVASKIDYVCENGAVNALGGEVFDTCPIPSDMGLEIIADLRALGMRLLVSGRHTCYVSADDRVYSDDIVYRLRNTVAIVDDPARIPEPFLKLSGYRPEGVADIAPALLEKWGGRLTATVSGEQWFDFTVSDKGTGLRALAERHGIPLCDVAAFGDQFNDESMLDIAGHPYVMRSGNPALRKPRYALCDKVLPVMKDILAQAERSL